MADEIEVRVHGLDELRAQLKALPDKLRRRALRNALAAGARVVRDESQRRAPVLRESDPRRTAGTVRNAIRVRTSKQARQAGDVGVFVNVRPLTGKQITSFKAASGRKGAANPNDPFYWRWLEFGRQGRGASGPVPARRVARAAGDRSRIGGLMRYVRARRALRAVGPLPAYGFLQAGAQRLQDALRIIEQKLGPMVQRIVDRQAQE